MCTYTDIHSYIYYIRTQQTDDVIIIIFLRLFCTRTTAEMYT